MTTAAPRAAGRHRERLRGRPAATGPPRCGTAPATRRVTSWSAWCSSAPWPSSWARASVPPSTSTSRPTRPWPRGRRSAARPSIWRVWSSPARSTPRRRESTSSSRPAPPASPCTTREVRRTVPAEHPGHRRGPFRRQRVRLRPDPGQALVDLYRPAPVTGDGTQRVKAVTAARPRPAPRSAGERDPRPHRRPPRVRRRGGGHRRARRGPGPRPGGDPAQRPVLRAGHPARRGRGRGRHAARPGDP